MRPELPSPRVALASVRCSSRPPPNGRLALPRPRALAHRADGPYRKQLAALQRQTLARFRAKVNALKPSVDIVEQCDALTKEAIAAFDASARSLLPDGVRWVPTYERTSVLESMQDTARLHVQTLQVQGLYLDKSSHRIPVDLSAHWLLMSPFGARVRAHGTRRHPHPTAAPRPLPPRPCPHPPALTAPTSHRGTPPPPSPSLPAPSRPRLFRRAVRSHDAAPESVSLRSFPLGLAAGRDSRFDPVGPSDEPAYKPQASEMKLRATDGYKPGSKLTDPKQLDPKNMVFSDKMMQ